MGELPRKEVCFPTKAILQGWAGLTLTLLDFTPRKELALVFSGTKITLCGRKDEVWVLHWTFLVWCIPRLQHGWVLGNLQPTLQADILASLPS